MGGGGQQTSARRSRVDGLIPNVVAPVNSTKINKSKDTFRCPSVRTTYKFIVICLFLFSTCELFYPTDPDMLAKIDAEIAWANAKKLDVTVSIPPGSGWGSSPQSGTNRCFDTIRTRETPRLGYPFNVEFEEGSGFSFRGWLAFNSNEYSLAIAAMDFEEAKTYSLNEKGVSITVGNISHTGSIPATITINIDVPVTLVPFCDTRPRILQTNPPLNNTGDFYNRRQQITIWINLGFEEDRPIAFGDDLIQIKGQYISNSMLYNETGDITNYFNTPEYIAERKVIVIIPDHTLPPPENLNITVTVGTGITGVNGYGMSEPVSFWYRINDKIVTEAYKASDIWAIHDPNTPRVENFFHQMAPSDRDRRLRKFDSQGKLDPVYGKYQVTLYFNVSRSVGEIVEPAPESFVIYEIHYADLAGKTLDENELEPNPENIRETPYHVITPLTDNDSAGIIYRQLNNVYNPLEVFYYKAVYTFENNDPEEEISGIYRLAVLPRREGVNEDDLKTLIKEIRYVTVVIDNKAPGGSGGITLTGEQYVNRMLNAHIYNSVHRNMVINTDFFRINDNNNEGGILLKDATPDKPWTMDERDNLSWRYQIVGINVNRTPSEWFSMSVSQEVINIFGLPVSNDPLEIKIQFKDNLGNENEWRTMGRIIYNAWVKANTIESWSAFYNEENNVIEISWWLPSNSEAGGVGIIIEKDGVSIGADTFIQIDKHLGGSNNSFYGTHIIPGVNRVIAPNITEGINGNFCRYRIIIDPNGVAEEVIIYNIPGMLVSDKNILKEIEDISQLTEMEETAGQYILTENITIAGRWEPIHLRSNFYGNGKTITFSDSASFRADLENYGIFGGIENGTIRDLIVEYKSLTDIEIKGSQSSNVKHVGGIVGYLSNSRLTNCIVRAENNITFNHSSENSQVHIGGMVGAILGSQITNCFAELNVKSIITTGNHSIHIGGLIGITSAIFNLENCYSTGNVNAENSGNIAAGGLIGWDRETSKIIRHSHATGNVTVKTNSGVFIGGLIGHTSAAIENSHAKGTVYAIGYSGYIGGLVGHTNGNVQDSYARGNVSAITNTFGEQHTGGLIGSFSSANGKIERCYATGDVFTIGNLQSVGGLLGISDYSYTSIFECYATGNVNVHAGGYEARVGGLIGWYRGDVKQSWANGDVTLDASIGNNSPDRIFAGGLIGVSLPWSQTPVSWGLPRAVTNCYALGKVKIDNNNSGNLVMHAGGLVGWIVDGYYIIEIHNSFAKGNVEIKSSSTSVSNDVTSGGIVGAASGAFNSVVALGERVTASKSNSGLFSRPARVNRICYRTNHHHLKAYALSTMQTGNSTGGYNATVTTNTRTGTTTDNHGESVDLERTKESSFWVGVGSTMGWDSAIWDTTGVEDRGYPLLYGFAPGVQE